MQVSAWRRARGLDTPAAAPTTCCGAAETTGHRSGAASGGSTGSGSGTFAPSPSASPPHRRKFHRVSGDVYCCESTGWVHVCDDSCSEQVGVRAPACSVCCCCMDATDEPCPLLFGRQCWRCIISTLLPSSCWHLSALSAQHAVPPPPCRHLVCQHACVPFCDEVGAVWRHVPDAMVLARLDAEV